jgi:hypothetical protein
MRVFGSLDCSESKIRFAFEKSASREGSELRLLMHS